jgi:hypothetical protein
MFGLQQRAREGAARGLAPKGSSRRRLEEVCSIDCRHKRLIP